MNKLKATSCIKRKSRIWLSQIIHESLYVKRLNTCCKNWNVKFLFVSPCTSSRASSWVLLHCYAAMAIKWHLWYAQTPPTSAEQNILSARMPHDKTDTSLMSHEVDDSVFQVCLESSLRNLPHFHCTVLGAAGNNIVVVGAPLNV